MTKRNDESKRMLAMNYLVSDEKFWKGYRKLIDERNKSMAKNCGENNSKKVGA